MSHSEESRPDAGFSLDHVAVAVSSIEEASPIFQLLSGATCSPVEELPDQGVNVAFVGTVELLEPRGPDTTVGRFLDRRGQALHHLAYRVPDLTKALARLRSAGVPSAEAARRLVREGLEELLREGTLATPDVESAFQILWAMVNGLISLHLVHAYDYPLDDELFDRAFDMVEAGLLRRNARRP